MFKTSRLETLKVGDHVKIIDSDWSWGGAKLGDSGVLAGVSGDNLTIKLDVQRDGRDITWFIQRNQVEKITAAAAKKIIATNTEKKIEGFAPGTLVKIVKASCGWGGATKGTIAVVTQNFGEAKRRDSSYNPYQYKVSFATYNGWQGIQSDFEALTPAEILEFLKEADKKAPKQPIIVTKGYPYIFKNEAEALRNIEGMGNPREYYIVKDGKVSQPVVTVKASL